MKVKSFRTAAMLVLVITGVVAIGCKSGKKQKEITELQAKLEKESQQHEGCKEKVAQLTDRVTRLENALKTIKEQPCEYELDPVTFQIRKKPATTSPGEPRPPRPARPVPGPPLNVAQVKTKIRLARKELKRCYVEALKRSSKLRAEPIWVTLRFTLYNSGKLGAIRLSPFVGGGFEPCVKREVRKWKFGRFGGFPKKFKQRMRLTPR